MVWIQGTGADLEKYVVMASRILESLPAVLHLSTDDQPGNQYSPFNSIKVNPDGGSTST